MIELSFAELKDLAQLANVILIPSLWILWKIDRKLFHMSIIFTVHEEKDKESFKKINERQTEIYERVRDLEIKNSR